MKAMGKGLRGAVGIFLLAVFVWLAVHFLDAGELQEAFFTLLHTPLILILITAAYALSFLLKAAAWRLYAEAKQPLLRHLAPIGYSLLMNHLLPVKAGDLIRTGLAAKLERTTWDESLHTVAVLRLMDISVLVLFGGGGLAVMGIAWTPATLWLPAAAAISGVILLGAGLRYAQRRQLPFAARQIDLLRRLRSRKAVWAWLITAASWVLEAAVPFGILTALHTPVSFLNAIWVNSMTVAGQLFQLTPGGIGTYETTMSASLAALGIGAAQALTVAVVSHAYKFLFSFAAGFVSWILLPVRIDEGIRWLGRRRIGKVEPAE